MHKQKSWQEIETEKLLRESETQKRVSLHFCSSKKSCPKIEKEAQEWHYLEPAARLQRCQHSGHWCHPVEQAPGRSRMRSRWCDPTFCIGPPPQSCPTTVYRSCPSLSTTMKRRNVLDGKSRRPVKRPVKIGENFFGRSVPQPTVSSLLTRSLIRSQMASTYSRSLRPKSLVNPNQNKSDVKVGQAVCLAVSFAPFSLSLAFQTTFLVPLKLSFCFDICHDKYEYWTDNS